MRSCEAQAENVEAGGKQPYVAAAGSHHNSNSIALLQWAALVLEQVDVGSGLSGAARVGAACHPAVPRLGQADGMASMLLDGLRDGAASVSEQELRNDRALTVSLSVWPRTNPTQRWNLQLTKLHGQKGRSGAGQQALVGEGARTGATLLIS